MIGRRAFGQRKIVLAWEHDGVYVVDPAIDIDKSDLRQYHESFFDLSHLSIRPGERPTFFSVRPMTRRQKDAIDGLRLREAASWVWRCGIVGFENYQILATDGTVKDADQPDAAQNGAFGMMASEKWLDELNLPHIHLATIAMMIRHLSEADLPLSKCSAPPSGDGTSSGKVMMEQS